MSIDNKKINLDSSNIFKISETIEYLAILHSKINNDYENIINLLLYDKFTQEIFNIDIIDYNEIEELNLDIKILNDFIYVLYQDKEKIFILKYEIGFDELNIIDLSENYEDFYLNDFINIEYSLYLHEKYIYFFYLNTEKRFILYKIGTNLNIVTEFEDESLSLELYFYVEDKTFMLIDILNNYYLSIDKYGKYNKISNYNLDNIMTSNNNYEKINYAYTQLFSKELCLGYYKNIISLRMNINDNKVSINIDNSDENENLVLDLDRNSNNKLELFVDNEKKMNLFESSKNIDVYQFEIINNYLIIVYSDKELDEIYNLKNISIINLDNYRRVDYINKFQKCYFLEKNLFLCNFRKYNNKNSLTIKQYNLSSDEIVKENTYDFKINENIDFISKCNYKIMFLVNNGGSNRNINNKSNLYFYDNVGTEDDYSYMWSSKELKKANRDLKAEYDETENYYTIDNLKSNGNDILVLGLGTYIIEGISSLHPISFDISNNSNIRFTGLGSNLFMIKQKINKLKGDKESLAEDNIFEYPHYPFRREDSNKNYIYFYYGTVKLVVTGEFDEIPGYYIYDTENDEISTNSIIPFKIKFESTSIPGYSNDRQLEIDELNSRKNYIFYHNGTSDNGVRVKGFDKKGFSLETDKTLIEEYQDETYFSYVEPYCDDITDCLYIRSNGIPNYIPFDNNTTGLEEMEVSSFGTDINGLDRQAYSYVSNSRRILGFPFKIPLNPQLTDLKNVPEDIKNTNNIKIQKESFWYRSDENWDKIMVNTGYSNFKIGNTGPTSLLPIGQIGVAVNGVPFHSPATMKNTILETPITANLSIKDPVVKRTLKKDNAPLDGIVDENNEDSNIIFDNYGGSVDKNSVYNYKRYPINLEADIVLGTIGYDKTSLTLDPNSTSEEKRNYYINTQRKKINDMLIHEDSNIIVIDIDNHEKTKFLKINLSDTSLKNISKLKLISSEIVEHTPTYSINFHISFSNVIDKFFASFGVTITENDHIKDIINNDYLKEYINYNGTQGEGINPHILIELTPEILHSFGYDNSGTVINNKIILKFGVEGSQVFELHISGNNNNTTKINYLKYLKYISNPDPEFKLYESKFTYEDDGENKTYEYNGILETDEKKKNFLDFMKKNNIHSPILGWSFDGFPIYGQIGYKKETLFEEVKFLGSSYKETKKYLQKTEIGVDNKITDVTGDLDLCNGIFLPTPEYPYGIYHYVCTVDEGNLSDVAADLEYQYPYVIGAYKALPEVSNFALLPSDSNLSNSTDNTVSSSSYGTSTSTSSGTTNSSTVVSETQNYSIKFRSIKADTYNYNSNQYRSIGISQDDDFIKIHATPKPYIWNLSGNKNNEPSNQFGLDNETFGAADNSITQLFNNGNVYGDVYKFKINGTVTVKQAVKIDNINDDNNLSVTNISKSDEPILGICVGKEEDDYAYIMTRGICEFEGNGLDLDISNRNIYYNGSLTSFNTGDTSSPSTYIVGTLLGISNGKNYIYVNPQYLVI